MVRAPDLFDQARHRDEGCPSSTPPDRTRLGLFGQFAEAKQSASGGAAFAGLATISMSHRWHTSIAFSDIYGSDDRVTMRVSAPRLPLEDYDL